MIFRSHPGLWGQSWLALSSCGSYAIKPVTTDPRDTRFDALHIPGVWATAISIGVRKTRAAAEALCEKHRPSLAAISQLAKGINKP